MTRLDCGRCRRRPDASTDDDLRHVVGRSAASRRRRRRLQDLATRCAGDRLWYLEHDALIASLRRMRLTKAGIVSSSARYTFRFYIAAGMAAKYCHWRVCVSTCICLSGLSVCLSVLSHILETARPNSTKCSVHFARGFRSVFLWRQ